MSRPKDFYSIIDNVVAEGGLVRIKLNDRPDVMITVDEAISRAEAIRGMQMEEHVEEMVNMLMNAAWQGQQQIKAMTKTEQQDFDYLEEANMNALFKYGQNRRVQL